MECIVFCINISQLIINSDKKFKAISSKLIGICRLLIRFSYSLRHDLDVLCLIDANMYQSKTCQQY